jgi:hypothetical protein
MLSLGFNCAELSAAALHKNYPKIAYFCAENIIFVQFSCFCAVLSIFV